jgi:transcriptional regulator with XRE-family HTH domain
MLLKSRSVFAKQFGKRVRALRVEKGISLKHFEALENAIDRHSLSNIEQGKKIPNIYTAYRIATVLKVPFEELFNNLK